MKLSDLKKSLQPGESLIINRTVYVQRVVNGAIQAEQLSVTDDEEDLEVHSDPPPGKYKVTNLYVNPATGVLEVEYDDNL